MPATGSDSPERHPNPEDESQGLMTLYATLRPWQALAIVSFSLAFVSAGIFRSGSVRAIRISDLASELSDSLVFRAVTDRVHAGEGYYDATAIELQAHGYPTRSVFNCRLLTYAWIFGNLPDPSWAGIILEACVLLAIGMASFLAARDLSLPMQLAVVALLTVADAWITFPGPTYFVEFWAGTLVLISLCFSFDDRWLGAIATGSIALALRELVLPFYLVMLGLAGWRRWWKELAAWLAVLVGSGLLFCLHSQEAAWRGAGFSFDRTLAWVAFGGVTSIL